MNTFLQHITVDYSQLRACQLQQLLRPMQCSQPYRLSQSAVVLLAEGRSLVRAICAVLLAVAHGGLGDAADTRGALDLRT